MNLISWGVLYWLKVRVERHTLPRFFPVLKLVRVHAHYNKFSRFLFSLVDTHPRKTRNFAPRENFQLYGIRSAIFPADNTHAHCAYASSRKLFLRPSFTMMILGLESSSLVVYLAGYRFSRDISETVVLL